MRAGWAPFVLSLVIAGCSWLVEPNDEVSRCSVSKDVDPCPQGLTCQSGRCIALTCVVSPEVCGDDKDNDCDGNTDERSKEVCNDLDDDCDDRVDEEQGEEVCGNHKDDDCDDNIDEGYDFDEDGFQWCGDTTKKDGEKYKDCDDLNPNANLTASEECDGVDNDCDGNTDEGGSKLCRDGEECVAQRCVKPSCAIAGSSEECPPDKMCNLDTGKCVELGCTEGSCEDGEYCDQTSGECRTERRHNGEPCIAHEDCGSGSCVDGDALRLDTKGVRVCGESCCRDEDCLSGERCFASGSGARSCLPSAYVPRSSSSPPPCSAEAHCAGDTSCAVVNGQRLSSSIVEARDNLTVTVCSDEGDAENSIDELCTRNDDCASLACVTSFDFFFGRCSAACRTSDDCDAFTRSTALGVKQRGYCRYMTMGTSTSSSGPGSGSTAPDYVSLCVIGQVTGNGGLGAPCDQANDCFDNVCIAGAEGGQGSCAPTCCNDSQCPRNGDKTSYCRPVAFGDHYEMRCVQ